MKRTYALKRLLEHGPLSVEEMTDITGWKETQVRSTICALDNQGFIGRQPGGRVRRYYHKDFAPVCNPVQQIQSFWVR